MGGRGKQLSRQMGKTFGAWKRHSKGAVPTLLRKQATTAMTQMTAAADNAAAHSWKETTIDTTYEAADTRPDKRGNKLYGVTSDDNLPKPIVSSSALRKFFPILVIEEEDGDDSWCRIGVAGVGARGQK